jgi:hypothetical protein
MQFTKEQLKQLAYRRKTDDGLEVVFTETYEPERWSYTVRQVFSCNGKYYQTFYQKGNTEYQEEEPYEYEDDLIECGEVVKKEILTVVYDCIV